MSDGDISSWNRRALGGSRTRRRGRRSSAQPPRNRAPRGTTSSPSKQEAIKTAICSRTRKCSAGRGQGGGLLVAKRIYLFVSRRKQGLELAVGSIQT